MKKSYALFILVIILSTSVSSLMAENINVTDDIYCTDGCIDPKPHIVLTAGKIELNNNVTFTAFLRYDKPKFFNCQGVEVEQKDCGVPTVVLTEPFFHGAAEPVNNGWVKMTADNAGVFRCGAPVCAGGPAKDSKNVLLNQVGWWVVEAEGFEPDCEFKVDSCTGEVKNCYGESGKIYCYFEVKDSSGVECKAKSFKSLVFEHEDAPYEEGGEEDWSSVELEFSSVEEDSAQCSYQVIAAYNTFINATPQICNLQCSDAVTTLDTVKDSGKYDKTIMYQANCGSPEVSGFYVVSHLDAHGTASGTEDNMVDFTQALPKRMGTVYDPVIQMNEGGDQSVNGCSMYGYINCGPFNTWSLEAVARDTADPTVNVPPGYSIKWSGIPIAPEQEDDIQIGFSLPPGRYIPRLEVWFTDPNDPAAAPVLVGEAELHSLVVEQNQGDNVTAAPNYLQNPEQARGCKFHVTNKAGGFTVDGKFYIEGGVRGRVSTDGYPQNEYWVTSEDTSDLPQVDRVEDGTPNEYYLQGYGEPSQTKNDADLKVEGQQFEEKCDECAWWLDTNNLVKVSWVATDEEPFTTVSVDLDVDSDNDNDLNVPDRSEVEEAIEFALSLAGKIILVSDEDDDSDSIPDWLDGWDISSDGTEENSSSHKLVPITIDYSNLIPDCKVSLSFETVDPYEGVVIEEELSDNRLAPKVRIWTKNGSENRDPESVMLGGDLIAPDELIDKNKLPPGKTLYVESLNPSSSTGDLTIKLKIHKDECVFIDEIKLTAVDIDLFVKCTWPDDIKTQDYFEVPTLGLSTSVRGSAPDTLANHAGDYHFKIYDPRKGFETLNIGDTDITMESMGNYYKTADYTFYPLEDEAHVNANDTQTYQYESIVDSLGVISFNDVNNYGMFKLTSWIESIITGTKQQLIYTQEQSDLNLSEDLYAIHVTPVNNEIDYTLSLSANDLWSDEGFDARIKFIATNLVATEHPVKMQFGANGHNILASINNNSLKVSLDGVETEYNFSTDFTGLSETMFNELAVSIENNEMKVFVTNGDVQIEAIDIILPFTLSGSLNKTFDIIFNTDVSSELILDTVRFSSSENQGTAVGFTINALDVHQGSTPIFIDKDSTTMEYNPIFPLTPVALSLSNTAVGGTGPSDIGKIIKELVEEVATEMKDEGWTPTNPSDAGEFGKEFENRVAADPRIANNKRILTNVWVDMDTKIILNIGSETFPKGLGRPRTKVVQVDMIEVIEGHKVPKEKERLFKGRVRGYELKTSFYLKQEDLDAQRDRLRTVISAKRLYLARAPWSYSLTKGFIRPIGFKNTLKALSLLGAVSGAGLVAYNTLLTDDVEMKRRNLITSILEFMSAKGSNARTVKGVDAADAMNQFFAATDPTGTISSVTAKHVVETFVKAAFEEES